MNEIAHVRGTTAESAGTVQTVSKIIVAVHGIGDQPNNGTIQAVVNQFCAFVGQPAGIPLGSFDGADGPLSIGAPHSCEVFKRFAFAEVYWATVPRVLVGDKHKLEEARAWARTIVERLRLRYEIERRQLATQRQGDAPPRPNFPLVKQILGELILTLGVLDRLCFLADKAGIFTFDLRRLLEDYLGDVQVVAEFRGERAKILAAFAETMERAHAKYPDAEIHIVAHSEGTVVAFLGLLEALRATPRPAWAEHVRGFMTLGSPLDKHFVLWPELFGSEPPAGALDTKIEWRNYYDFGDPVGFELDGVREWMREGGWTDVFHFRSEKDVRHDHGFTRYPFPGKAHVDYWADEEVFGHFLQEVVGEKPEPGEDGRPRDFTKPPATRRWARVVSELVPFAAIAGLLLGASWILLKAVFAVVFPATQASIPGMALAVRAGGLAALLLGVTAVSRVPRLTWRKTWRGGALLAALGCVVLFQWSVSASQAIISGGAWTTDITTLQYAAVVTVLIFVLSTWKPEWGLKPLLLIGTPAVILRVATVIGAAMAEGTQVELWPVVLATAAFVYLWWLAALLLDLVIVWHLYIRDFHARRQFDEMTGRARAQASRPAGSGAARWMAWRGRASAAPS